MQLKKKSYIHIYRFFQMLFNYTNNNLLKHDVDSVLNFDCLYQHYSHITIALSILTRSIIIICYLNIIIIPVVKTWMILRLIIIYALSFTPRISNVILGHNTLLITAGISSV